MAEMKYPTGGMDLDPKYDNYEYPIVSPTDGPGQPGHLKGAEMAQVHQLRMSLEAKGYKQRLDTVTMLRFLRADSAKDGKFDVKKSEERFVQCEDWRKKENLDELVRNWTYPEKEALFQYYPQYYHKVDKDGRPVYIESLGKANLTVIRTITTDERMLNNLAVEYERCGDPRFPACSRKANHLVETCTTILDLKDVGLGTAKSVYGYLQKASYMSQNYYPERLGQLYVINAPFGFSTVWYYVSKWLDPNTQAKVHILGSGYQKELLKHVPAENLPKQFGGSCDCPGGCQFSDQGPWRDPEWARPAWWEKKAETTEPGAQVPIAQGEEGHGEKAPATA